MLVGPDSFHETSPLWPYLSFSSIFGVVGEKKQGPILLITKFTIIRFIVVIIVSKLNWCRRSCPVVNGYSIETYPKIARRLLSCAISCFRVVQYFERLSFRRPRPASAIPFQQQLFNLFDHADIRCFGDLSNSMYSFFPSCGTFIHLACAEYFAIFRF